MARTELLLHEFVAPRGPEGDPHREARSTLTCVTPNDLLIDQWLQHLEYAGIPRSQILHYGDFTAARRAVGQPSSLRGRRKPRSWSGAETARRHLLQVQAPHVPLASHQACAVGGNRGLGRARKPRVVICSKYKLLTLSRACSSTLGSARRSHLSPRRR